LGRTVYSTAYPIAQLPSAQAALALTMLPRLKEYTVLRRRNAEAILARLRGAPGVQQITPVAAAEPAFVRLPVLFDRSEVRDAAVIALNRAGIGATRSYPTSIADISELRSRLRGGSGDAVGGRIVAARILTLPTHPYVTRADTDVAVDVILDVLESARRANGAAPR
jgi:dTDP-4-amino-4,6-dideoxygalactose transaminase